MRVCQLGYVQHQDIRFFSTKSVSQHQIILVFVRKAFEIEVDGLAEKVAPLSTVGGVVLVNCIKAEVAGRLAQAGAPPKVLAAACTVGRERSTELFEAAYDEHARRMATLYQNLGTSS